MLQPAEKGNKADDKLTGQRVGSSAVPKMRQLSGLLSTVRYV
jgi:hypothetical protein